MDNALGEEIYELERCIECDSCVRSCPMEIDIRHGYQVECTNCGSCLDACRKVMAKRGEPGLIRSTFGLQGEGVRGLLNPLVLLPAVAIIALLLTFSVALVDRPVGTVKVAVSRTAASRQLADAQFGTFFNAWVNNRSQEAAVYTITARQKESGAPLPLKGQVRATVAAGEHRRLVFVLVAPTDKSLTIEFLLRRRRRLGIVNRSIIYWKN